MLIQYSDINTNAFNIFKFLISLLIVVLCLFDCFLFLVINLCGSCTF